VIVFIGVAGFRACGFTPQSALISEICLFQHSETWQQKSFTPWWRSLALQRPPALPGGSSNLASPSRISLTSNPLPGLHPRVVERRVQLAQGAAHQAVRVPWVWK
jgi:hypothetical protein